MSSSDEETPKNDEPDKHTERPMWYTVSKWYIIGINVMFLVVTGLIAFLALVNLSVFYAIIFVVFSASCIVPVYGFYNELYIYIILSTILLVIQIVIVISFGFNYRSSLNEYVRGSGDYIALFLLFFEIPAVFAVLYELYRNPAKQISEKVHNTSL